MMSVGLTPGGSPSSPKNDDASSSRGTDRHAVVALWLWWALPPPLASVSLNSTVLVVASVTAKLVATGTPCRCSPTTCPAPLLCSLGATDTVIVPTPSHWISTSLLPG